MSQVTHFSEAEFGGPPPTPEAVPTAKWSDARREGRNAPGISDAGTASRLLECQVFESDFAHTLSDL